MKMKTLMKYAAVLMALFSINSACTGPDDVEVVPEGVLKIFADKESIAADGVDCVTFRVMYGSTDVSNEKTMKLVWTASGKDVEMSPGSNKFSTTAPGQYVFKAYLYSGGDCWSENTITVTASEVAGQKAYRHLVLGEQFTSVGCVNCPTLSVQIKEVQQQMPGILVPVSFHMDYNMYDPMSTEATNLFYKAYGMSGLPFFNLNMRKRDGGVNREAIKAAIEDELELFPATCGVAIDTEYDPSTREVSVTTKITSNVAARHKYHVFLIEDGIEYEQSGASGLYIHNNVVRKMFAQDITGLNINSRNPFTPGVEVTAVNSTVLAASWNPENMRVVVAALTTSDGGVTFVCNNVNVCKLGESIDYMLK